MAYLTRGSFGVPVYNRGRPALPANFGDWIASLDAANAPPPSPEPTYDPGPYYDPGGYDPGPAAPPPTPYDPATDPSFQALLAQLGLRETSARTAATGQIARAQQDAAIVKPRISEGGVEQRRGVDSSFLNSGFYRSGERLRQLAVQRRGEVQRLGDVDRGLATRIAGVNESLDQQIRDLAFQRAQYELQARQTAASTGLYS